MQLELTEEQALALREQLDWVKRHSGTALCNAAALNEVLVSVETLLKPKLYTVICMEADSNYPDPLIYTIELVGKPEEEKVLSLVQQCRRDDLDGDGVTEEELEKWLSVLRVCLVFEGDQAPVADWRS